MLQTGFSDLVEQHQGYMYRYAFALLHNGFAETVTEGVIR